MASALAKRLGFTVLHSGLLYRTVAWQVVQQSIDPMDREAVEALCPSLPLETPETTAALHTTEVDHIASIISTYLGVRANLLSVQRALAGNGGVVAEGRDMGTVVFPAADLKFYLDASPTVRAQRRLQQGRGTRERAEVEAAMVNRDNRDHCRAIAPLTAAHDAIIIDSTRLTLETVVETLLKEINRKIY